MFKKRTAKLSIVLTIVLSLLISGFTYAAEPSKSFQNLDERIDYLKLMIQYIEAKYKYDVTEEQLMDGAFKGVFEVLDQHSTYFEPEEYDSFNVDSSGKFGGIGIEVGYRNGHITVISPIDGTPGQRAGFKTGDIIKYVDDTDVSSFNLEKAVVLMRGEPGTSVKIGVVRGNNPEIIYLDIVREVIEVNPIKYETLENNIGYIKISSFNSNTDENIVNVLEQFNQNNTEGIIVDLRNNPGGLLSEVITVADLFLEKDTPIVHIEYRDNRKDSHKAKADKLIDKPLVVLVNEGSASASEIFAGAMQDTGRGIIIGTQTYGKGTVQTVTPITNGGGIKLTIAEYLTSNERKIDGIGVTPDIVIENPDLENKEEIINFVPMIEDAKPRIDDKGLNVYGAQQRLKYLGYDVNITGIMDEQTVEVIKSFQKSQGLHPYGVLDWTTRDKISEKAIDLYNNGAEDLQLQKAIEKIKDEIK